MNTLLLQKSFLRSALPLLGLAFLFGRFLFLRGFPLLALFTLPQPGLLLLRLLLLLFALLLGLWGRALRLVGHHHLHRQGNIHQNASRTSRRMRDQMSRKIQQAISTRRPMNNHRHMRGTSRYSG